MTAIHSALVLASVGAEQSDDDARTTLINNALPIAGLFVLLLLIAMYFLWRSMSKQMKRIDPTLPAGVDDRRQQQDRELTQEAIERGRAQNDPGAQ